MVASAAQRHVSAFCDAVIVFFSSIILILLLNKRAGPFSSGRVI